MAWDVQPKSSKPPAGMETCAGNGQGSGQGFAIVTFDDECESNFLKKFIRSVCLGALTFDYQLRGGIVRKDEGCKSI